MNKNYFVFLLSCMCLYAHAQTTVTNKELIEDFGRLTIHSEFTGGWLKGDNEIASGIVYINGQEIHEFSSNNPVFSQEYPRGIYKIEVCESHLFGKRLRCLETRVQIEKEVHTYLLHKEKREITGTTRNLSLMKSIRYQNISEPVNSQIEQKTVKSTNSSKSNAVMMEESKKKCIELGFKVGTESFGNCILKLSN